MSSISAKNRIYINKTHTHIHKVELESLYLNFVWLLQNRFLLLKETTTNYWSLSVSRAISKLIMRLNKPTFAYKLVQLSNNSIKTHTQKKTINNLTRMNWTTQLINKHSQ